MWIVYRERTSKWEDSAFSRDILGSGRGGRYKAEDHSAEYVSSYDVGEVRRFWNFFFSQLPGVYKSLPIDLNIGWMSLRLGPWSSQQTTGASFIFSLHVLRTLLYCVFTPVRTHHLKNHCWEGIMCMMKGFTGCLQSTSLPEHIPIPELPLPGSWVQSSRVKFLKLQLGCSADCSLAISALCSVWPPLFWNNCCYHRCFIAFIMVNI